MKRHRSFAVLAAALLVGGCAGVPQQDAGGVVVEGPGERAAQRAANLVGMPYRFGGASPIDGFDCSGLIFFSYREAGVTLPRTTEALRLAAQPIAAGELRPGDLIFFDLQGMKNSHVGIYAGRGAFVHAPSTGKDVRLDRLDAPYWKRQLSETRRPIT